MSPWEKVQIGRERPYIKGSLPPSCRRAVSYAASAVKGSEIESANGEGST